MIDFKLLADKGMVLGMNESEYHQVEALSQSGLKEYARSPAHYHVYLNEPLEETPAMRAGKIVHLMLLEPELIKQKIAVVDGNRNSNDVKAKIAEAESFGRMVCKSEELEKYSRAIEKLKNHKSIKYILDGAKHEVSLFWYHPEHGFPCKARLDVLNLDKGMIFDPKWTAIDLIQQIEVENDPMRGRKASPVETQLYNMKYHWQIRWYLDAAKIVLKKEIQHAGFIFIENCAPFTILPICPDFGFTELAEQEMQPYLAAFKNNFEHNYWPGLEEKVFDASAPSWAFT